VLLPSVMQLLGRWNWYLPGWLEWMPRLQVEAASSRPGSGPALESGRG
jgi:putative drug exporter of the RND superfamily